MAVGGRALLLLRADLEVDGWSRKFQEMCWKIRPENRLRRRGITATNWLKRATGQGNLYCAMDAGGWI